MATKDKRTMCYIANSRFPTEKAHGIQIAYMVEQFAKHYATVLLLPNRKGVVADSVSEYYGIKDTFRVRRVWNIDLLSSAFPKKLAFFLQNMTFLLSATSFLRRKKFNVCFTRDVVGCLAAWSSGHRKVYYEIHSLPKRGRWFHKRLWQQASGLIVISKGLKDELVEQGIAPERIVIARDAVDLEAFGTVLSVSDARSTLDLPKEKKICMYVGHLYHWKGASVVAEAAKHLPDALFYLVGGTKEDIAAFKKTYADVQNLHMVGMKERETIPTWQVAADVLLLPTRGDSAIGSRYTSPLKMFEYMAVERPIVATDIPSLREVLTDDSAFFFNDGDSKDLAKKISEIIADPSAAKKRAGRAADIVKDMTWERRTEDILAFIEQTS